MRLLVAANSAPAWRDGAGLLPRSPGGLVPLLSTLLARHGGDWVCTVPADERPGPGAAPAEVVRLPGGITLHRLCPPRAAVDAHYDAVGVRVLLWLFHYLLDTARAPDDGLAAAWPGYESVNAAYAERLDALATGADDELVLVNDHHLFLVPGMLRRARRVAYFHGLPWCEPDYFGVLPGAVRERILTSLLRADVVGFHSGRWARAFVACCARYLPGCAPGDGAVAYDGRRTRVVTAPFPLDVDAVDRLRGEPATARWAGRLAAAAAGRRIVARADRVDLWKNLPRGFAAWADVLERDPGLAARWWFCAVATPPGRPNPRTLALVRECERLVAAVNDRFGAPGRPAVSMVHPDAPTTRNAVVAALGAADVTLVNPTFDGMNLVAKEALYLGRPGRVLLSVNAGAYEQLAGHVTPVHPFDPADTAAALHTAVTTTGDAPDGAAARRLLRGHDAGDWLARMTGDHA